MYFTASSFICSIYATITSDIHDNGASVIPDGLRHGSIGDADPCVPGVHVAPVLPVAVSSVYAHGGSAPSCTAPAFVPAAVAAAADSWDV